MWTYDTVFYQIYPIGFCGAPAENPGAGGNEPQRPRIAKIGEWADYIAELGAGAVLLNPIFQSSSHGYDTIDFRNIDSRLGTNEDFAAVCRKLHDKGIRIVLDGVFNHVGREFWAFKDVREKKWDSPYKDWFHISFDGNSCFDDGFWYEGWEGHFELVKLNLQNPAVTDYLLDCVRYWVDTFDIDGLRLDVAYCLDSGFMRGLREYTARLKADFTLIGEVLFGDYNLIVNDGMLDSCTNYECYKGLYSAFNSMNMFEIAHSLHRQYGSDPWCIYQGKHLMTFVDNHDVTRIASILSDKNHLPLVYAVLMGMPGVPCIYYGSEWGCEGEKTPGSDLLLRPCFEAPRPNELTETVKKLIAIRESNEALCFGGYRNVVLTNKQLIFERKHEDKRVFVGVNADAEAYTAWNDELRGEWKDLLTGEMVTLDGNYEMLPYSMLFFEQ